MKKTIFIGVIIVLFVIVVLIIHNSYEIRTNEENSILYIDTGEEEVMVELEIVTTDKEQQRGLMFRESLERQKGMLFVFDEEQVRTFWMKNTLIPLDMIFINKKLRIVDIITNASPCKTEVCPLYTSKKPATYVLEVNAGFVEEYEIEEGDKVDFVK